MPEVGAVIRRARAGAGPSQAELAELAGTSQPALARYETGTTLATLPRLERLLAACGRGLQVRAVGLNLPSALTTSLRGRLGPQARWFAATAGVCSTRRASVASAGCARSGRSPVATPWGAATSICSSISNQAGRTWISPPSAANVGAITGMAVDVATLDMLKERIRAEVLAEAVPL
jgi:uncharacterized protein